MESFRMSFVRVSGGQTLGFKGWPTWEKSTPPKSAKTFLQILCLMRNLFLEFLKYFDRIQGTFNLSGFRNKFLNNSLATHSSFKLLTAPQQPAHWPKCAY